MATSSSAAAEIQPVQEQAAETVRSPEASAVDRASAEQATAEQFVRQEATQTMHEVQTFGEVANDAEFPEAGAEAASATEAAKTEISAVAQKAESQIAAEVNPLPPVMEAEKAATPEGEAKLKELESLGEQAKARMTEIFEKLMEMKASGGKLDAGEYETYIKMLDEDPMLNEFVQKIQAEFNNEQNEGPVRAKAAELAGAFAEGARNQQAFAEQMARRGAAAAPGAVPNVEAAAVAAAGAAGAEAMASAAPPEELNETPSLKGLREDAKALIAKMETARSFNNSELLDETLEKLIKTKKSLLEGLTALPMKSSRQSKEIELLAMEISKYEKEQEIRVEQAKLKELEIEKKTLEAEILTLSKGDDPEALAHAKERLTEVQGKIEETNQRISTLRGQQAGIDNLFRTEAERQAKPVDIGEKIGSAAESLADTAIDIFKL